MDLTLRFYSKNKHLLRKEIKAEIKQTGLRCRYVSDPLVWRVGAERKTESPTIIGSLSMDIGVGYDPAKHVYVLLSTTGQLYYPKDLYARYNDLELIKIVQRWAHNCYRQLNAKTLMKQFWETAKEELVATVWRPERVAKWVEAGVDVETL